MNLPGTAFAYVMVGLDLIAFVAALFALVDAAIRPGAAFRYVERGTKGLWVGILVAAVLVSALGAGGLFNIIGLAALVASIVYLVDMRPKLRQLGGGRSGRGGRSPSW